MFSYKQISLNLNLNLNTRKSNIQHSTTLKTHKNTKQKIIIIEKNTKDICVIFAVDHTRVKLKDVNQSTGSEYINANYIRQSSDAEPNDMVISTENLNNSHNLYHQQKNCSACQLSNKVCSQCAMKSTNIISNDVSIVIIIRLRYDLQ